MIVLGIDPGVATIGFGVIRAEHWDTIGIGVAGYYQ